MMMSYDKQIEIYALYKTEIDVLTNLNNVISEFRRKMVSKKLNQDLLINIYYI